MALAGVRLSTLLVHGRGLLPGREARLQLILLDMTLPAKPPAWRGCVPYLEAVSETCGRTGGSRICDWQTAADLRWLQDRGRGLASPGRGGPVAGTKDRSARMDYQVNLD